MEKQKHSLRKWIYRGVFIISAMLGSALAGAYATYRVMSQPPAPEPIRPPSTDSIIDVKININSVGTLGDEIKISINQSLIARAYVSCMTNNKVGEFSLQSFGNNVAGSNGDQNFFLAKDFVFKRSLPVTADGTLPANLMADFNKVANLDVCAAGKPDVSALTIAAHQATRMLMEPVVSSEDIFFQTMDMTAPPRSGAPRLSKMAVRRKNSFG